MLLRGIADRLLLEINSKRLDSAASSPGTFSGTTKSSTKGWAVMLIGQRFVDGLLSDNKLFDMWLPEWFAHLFSVQIALTGVMKDAIGFATDEDFSATA